MSARVRVVLEIGCANGKSSDQVQLTLYPDAHGSIDNNPAPTTFKSTFVKQGQRFPWTWRRRSFEIGLDNDGNAVLSYRDGDVKKGSLKLSGCRLRVHSIKLPPGMLLSDEMLQREKAQKSMETRDKREPEIIFEASNGRALVARASSDAECKQWLEVTSELLVAASAKLAATTEWGWRNVVTEDDDTSWLSPSFRARCSFEHPFVL